MCRTGAAMQPVVRAHGLRSCHSCSDSSFCAVVVKKRCKARDGVPTHRTPVPAPTAPDAVILGAEGSMAKYTTDEIGPPGKPPKVRGFPWRLWMFALLMTAAAGAA